MKHNAEVAQFRFALIAPVIQGLFPDASATAYYKRVSAAPLTLLDGTTVKYSYKTLEKWKSQYSIGGLDALMPVSRSDKSTSRSLNDEAVAEIYRIKKEYPRMNATQIYERLVKDSFIPATVSVDSVVTTILNQPEIRISATAKPSKRMRSERTGRQIHAICLISRKTDRPGGSTAS